MGSSDYKFLCKQTQNRIQFTRAEIRLKFMYASAVDYRLYLWFVAPWSIRDGRTLCQEDRIGREVQTKEHTRTRWGETPGLKQNNPRAISPRDTRTNFITVAACHASAPNMAKASRCHISLFFHSFFPLGTITSLVTCSYLRSLRSNNYRDIIG